MKVLVLGCGPAGLLAAEACRQADVEFEIVSRKDRSIVRGAQYLHAPIPGVTNDEPDFFIQYIKLGTRDGYRNKVYGEQEQTTSWELHDGIQPAWSLYQAYEKLWDRFERHIQPGSMGPSAVEAALEVYDYVFSTIPLPAICRQPVRHTFHKAVTWFQLDGHMSIPEQTILYNGLPGVGWHRASLIDGVVPMVEWSWPQKNAPFSMKPQSTDCDCWRGTPLIRLGRFGQWTRDELVHSAYLAAKKAVA